VYATSTLKAGESYDMLVRAADRSAKSMSTLARVSLSVEAIPVLSENVENHPPSLSEKASRVSVLESDPVGHLVALVIADDKVRFAIFLMITLIEVQFGFNGEFRICNVFLCHQNTSKFSLFRY